MTIKSFSYLHPHSTTHSFINDFANYFHISTSSIQENLIHSFADGELYITGQRKDLHSPLLVQLFSFHQELSINDQLFSLFLTIKKLKYLLQKPIVLVVPYLPYARHDTPENNNNDVHMLLSLFKDLGVEACITCDIHNDATLSSSPFPLYSLSLTDFWASLLANIILDNSWIIAAPDKGSIPRASALAQKLGIPLVHMSKERFAPNQTRVISLEGNVRDKNVILIDDIIDTGTTAINSLETLLEHEARSVVGCFSHAVLSKDAYERLLYSRFHHVYITDSLDVAPFKNNNKITCIPLGNYVAHNVDQLLAKEIKIV